MNYWLFSNSFAAAFYNIFEIIVGNWADIYWLRDFGILRESNKYIKKIFEWE